MVCIYVREYSEPQAETVHLQKEPSITLYLYFPRCGAVGGDTALQAGRPQFRFCMASMEYFIVIIRRA